jgi:hypothetical protein
VSCRFVTLLATSALLGVACQKPQSGGSEVPRQQAKVVAPTCGPVVITRFGANGVGLDRVGSSLPALLRRGVDSVLNSDTLDLDCDGRLDYVAQVIPKGGGAKPTLVVALSAGDTMRQVLSSESPVDGLEATALAADLTGSGKLDLVTVGHDEGGFVVRVFRWDERGLTPVQVPLQYRVREEADWSPECQSKINPSLSPDSGLILLRETIPPTARKGHGESCELPVDTLHVRGDGLVR